MKMRVHAMLAVMTLASLGCSRSGGPTEQPKQPPRTKCDLASFSPAQNARLQRIHAINAYVLGCVGLGQKVLSWDELFSKGCSFKHEGATITLDPLPTAIKSDPRQDAEYEFQPDPPGAKPAGSTRLPLRAFAMKPKNGKGPYFLSDGYMVYCNAAGPAVQHVELALPRPKGDQE